MNSLEDKIGVDNPARFIETFVECISLEALGFTVQTIKSEGRPSFDTKLFLKIYLYGYLNGLRSSRKLEKECVRNIELQWLLEDIRPNYHSISDFRKQNPAGLRKLFKLFVFFLKDADLIARETIAIDGTKSRAHNSKKANFSQKKIDKHLAFIEERTQEYLTALETNDVKESSVKIQNIQAKITRLKSNKIRYELLEENGSHKKVGEKLLICIKKQMDFSIFSSFLPEGLLSHFNIVDFKELGNLQNKKDCFYIYLHCYPKVLTKPQISICIAYKQVVFKKLC